MSMPTSVSGVLDALLVAGGGALLAGLGAAAVWGGPDSGSLDATKLVPGLDWRNCWVHFTPDAYEEMIARVTSKLTDPEGMLRRPGSAAVIYEMMECLRDAYLQDPSLAGVRAQFYAGGFAVKAWRYSALHDGVKRGDTSVLDERERMYLRMFLDAARTYFSIARQMEERGTGVDVAVVDLAKVVCVSEERVREQSEEVSRKRIKAAEENLDIGFQMYNATSLEDLLSKSGRFGRHQMYEQVVRSAKVESYVLEACCDRLQRLRLRGVRPLDMTKYPGCPQ